MVPFGDGLAFFLDGNSKITGDNGSFAKPTPNAFSLPAAAVEGAYSGHCPGSTPTCRASCYVRGLAKTAPDIYERYEANAIALKYVLRGGRTALHAAIVLAAWIRDNAAGGFRWHVSGDVWDQTHAQWITDVCRLSKPVRHWIYTRTLEAVPILTEASNLAVNVSADADNFPEARAVAREYGARLCYMASADGRVPPLPDGSVIFPDYALRGRPFEAPLLAPWWLQRTARERALVCPADYFGQSEQHRCGPCRKCLK